VNRPSIGEALPFCRARGIGAYSFYKWRRRLRQGDVAQFALLETTPTATGSPDSALELVLRNGERLRIGYRWRRHCGWCWRPCEDDPPAGERARVLVSEAVRHAPELRRAARAGERPPRVGCFRWTSLALRDTLRRAWLAANGDQQRGTLGAAERHRSEHGDKAETLSPRRSVKHFHFLLILLGNGRVCGYSENTSRAEHRCHPGRRVPRWQRVGATGAVERGQGGVR
jgi:hypothetical protein